MNGSGSAASAELGGTATKTSAEAGSVDVFVARQPIFDQRSNVFGYELLYRDGLQNRYTGTDPEQASVSVIANSFFVMGIEALTGKSRAFVNFTRENLLGGLAYVLPRDRLVVEILESVEVDDTVRTACQKLKDAGFTLALDDFTPDVPSASLLDLVDLVKIDFLATPMWQRAKLGRELTAQGKTLLAEKVETHEDVAQALRFGYTYIQGYFFARPEIHVGKRSQGFRGNRVEIIRELNREEPDLHVLEDLLKHDPDLTYRLLRYLNSAAFSLRNTVTSIRRAMMFLGLAGLRDWATIVILADIGTDKPFEIVVTSVVRGRFCELLGRELQSENRSSNFFLMGLFSLIDVLTDRDMKEALADLPLGTETRDALLGAENGVRPLLDLARTFEQADWQATGEIIAQLGLPADRVPALYFEAVEWGNRSAMLK